MLRVKLTEFNKGLLFISFFIIGFSEFDILRTSFVQLSLPQIFSVICGILVFLMLSLTKTKSISPLKTKGAIFALFAIMFFFITEFLATLLIDGGESAFQVVKTRLLSSSVLFATIYCFYLSGENINQNKSFYFFYLLSVLLVSMSIILVGLNYLYFDFGRYEHLHTVGVLGFTFTRNAGLLFNYGDVALMFSFVLPYAFYLIFQSNKKHKFLGIFALVIICIASIVSLSRNVWLSCLVSSVSFAVLALYSKKKIGFYVLTLMLLLLPVLVIFLFGTLMEYFEAALYLRIDAVSSRTSQYEYALQEISENVITGIGAQASQASQGYAIHNMFLNAFVRAGVGGIGFIVVILVTAFRLLKLSNKNLYQRMIAAGYIGFICSGMFYPAISSSSPIVWGTLGVFLVFSFNNKSY